jgi:DNA polymerase-3 subunit delta'
MKVDEALACLDGARQAGRLAQGYVVEGPLRGEGMELAVRLLSLLFCEMSETAGAPCGHCRGCRQVTEHTHPDILWLEPQKKSRQISVDQIRDLQSRMYQTSYGGGWKAAVIVGADRLNLSAGNAFLKVLEEPPGQCLFLLLSEAPQFLLPTILSRCQRLSVGRDELRLPETWRHQLVELLVENGDGRVEGARIVAIERSTARLEALLKEVKKAAALHEGELAEAESTEESDETLEARIAARYRELRSGVLRALLSWQRDILLLLCGGAPSLVYFAEQLEVLTARAGTLSYPQAMANVVAIETMNRKLEQNLPERLVIADTFHRLR